MPNLKNGKNCCGCTACEAVCGHQAIEMKEDTLGFKYPHVDISKCIECGLCEKVCSFNDNYQTPNNFVNPIPFGVRLKNIEEVKKSRSGGAFVAFSDWILEKKGVIYGVGYKNHFEVTHKRALTDVERDEFRKSKYVQSNLSGIFVQVRNDLLKGIWVMFTGTPCQVSGLQSFIPDNLKSKLITVDIVCHGVPSPKIWMDYIKYIENKEKKTVVGVDFRNKTQFGWRSHRETFTLFNPKSKKISNKTFRYVFYKSTVQRPSCGVCHYCNLRRPSDLTLADFWGWEKTDSKINADDLGLSLVFINNKKGKVIFEDVKSQFYIIEPKLENCIQNHLQSPTKPNIWDLDYIRDYERYGFKYVMRKYGDMGLKSIIRKIMKKIGLNMQKQYQ